MKRRFISHMLFLLGLFAVCALFPACGDDDDDSGDDDTEGDDDTTDDDTADDDMTDDDDEFSDPLDHIGDAWALAESEITETPELFTLFQIDGEAQNFEVELMDKIFDWTYWFYAEWDMGSLRSIWTVTLKPEEKVELVCDESSENCEVLGREFLSQDNWYAATLGYQAMVALAALEVGGVDIWYISIFKDLNPDYDFIGYYLQDESDVVLVINAETGEVVPE